MDACFNVLAGAAMQASMRLVADNGCFCEIGKRDQVEHVPIDSAIFLRGVSYAVDCFPPTQHKSTPNKHTYNCFGLLFYSFY